MGANVTCRAVTTNGSIFLTYEDNNPNVGAIIDTGNTYIWREEGLIPLPRGYFKGFEIGYYSDPPRVNEFFSKDYPTNNNYEILLINKDSDDSGIYLLDLSSESS